MKHCNAQAHRNTWRIIVWRASVAALTGALTAGLLQPAVAEGRSLPLAELREAWSGTLPAVFGA